jgi:cell division FtsZ-interacting protein ZapD
MAVAKILEETDHPDARIRLKALEMLGKVTEVGLFTERIEIKKTELSDVELDERIKQKLQAIQKTIEVDATEVESVEDEQDH